LAGRDTKWTLVASIGGRERLPPGQRPPNTKSGSPHDATGGHTHDPAASDTATADA
jgi:hypothetical protein